MEYAIAIHGGAGDLPADRLEEPYRSQYKQALTTALEAGRAILRTGGKAVDDVQAAVQCLEDCPLFNAGHGAALCSDGSAELDASIMDGADARCGAVAAVTTIKNPVAAAAHLLNHQHVFMVSTAADQLAKNAGLSSVDNNYFITEMRKQQWLARKDKQLPTLDHESGGTVGCVARDSKGHLAAATSTGGMMGQLPGRVGDSAIIGAGTWAEDGVCAVSATGTGETFIQAGFASSIAHQIKLAGKSIEQAAQIALDQVQALGGKGGCIIMSAEGESLLPMNSQHMLRAWSRGEDDVHCAIAGDEI